MFILVFQFVFTKFCTKSNDFEMKIVTVKVQNNNNSTNYN